MRSLLVGLATGETHPGIDHVTSSVPYVGRRDAPALLGGHRVFKTHELYDERYRNVIYLVRDVRAVFLSTYWRSRDQFGESSSLDAYLERFLTGQVYPFGAWQEHVASWMEGLRFSRSLIVRYESMTEDTIRELSRVAAFLGVEPAESTLEAVINGNSFDSMMSRLAASGRAVSRSEPGGWKAVLDREHNRAIWEAAGHALTRLGYTFE